MTPAGFPHSEIHGSKPGRRLPVAYRSHPRPSSASGAKASTVGSFLLGSFFLPCLLDARARSAVLKGRAGRSRQVRAVVPAGRRRLSSEELAGVEEAGAPSQRNSERRANSGSGGAVQRFTSKLDSREGDGVGGDPNR